MAVRIKNSLDSLDKPELTMEALANLNRRSLRGGLLTLGFQGANVLIQLVFTVVLARLLSPDDFGIIGMVLAVTAFAGLFRDLGLSSAAIQASKLTKAQQSNLFWLNIGMGTVLSVAVAFSSPAIAVFYGRDELLAVTLALSPVFLIGSLGAQCGATLAREMKFGRRSVATLAGSVVTLGVAAVLALQAYSYWSLVWGHLAGTFVTTLLLVILSSFRPGLPTRGTDMRRMLKFGGHVAVFDLINYFHRNLDDLLIGRFWGSVSLGFYSRAYSLLMLPIHAIRRPLVAVAFPALSKLQHHPVAFRAYFLRLTSILAFLSMPLTAFLFGTSDAIVQLALGEEWADVVPIFSVLAIAAFIQPVAGLTGDLLLSLGRGRRYFYCGLFNSIILTLCFVGGLPWGALGVATAYAIGNYVILCPWLFWALRDSPVNVVEFARTVLFPAILSLVSLLSMKATLHQVSPSGDWMSLLLGGIVYLISFLSLMLITEKGRNLLIDVAGLKRLWSVGGHSE